MRQSGCVHSRWTTRYRAEAADVELDSKLVARLATRKRYKGGEFRNRSLTTCCAGMDLRETMNIWTVTLLN